MSDLPHAGIGEDEDPTRVYALTKNNLERIVIDIIRNTTGIGPAFQHQLLPAVRKELGLALKRVFPPNNREFVVSVTQHSEPTNLELKFLNKLSQPVLTGRDIKGEDGSACVKIALVEVGTGKIIDFGPEASATVEIVVVPEHPDNAEPVLPACKSFITGSRFINLKEGIGLLDGIYIPHKRSWRKRCQLMLGANVVGNFDRVTIKGAKSEPFILRDSRLPLYQKHHPPSLSDKVWRLNNISKGGILQKRLSGNSIETVEDFLKMYHINPQQLQEILGSGMSSKKLNDTVRHGLDCRLEEKFLYTLPDFQQQPCGVIFNRVGQVLGLQREHCNMSHVQTMSETEKVIAQNLIEAAFADWENVIPYDVSEAKSPPSVFDRAQPGTCSQVNGSSSGLMPRSPTAVFEHARPSISSQGINSSTGWIPKSPTAVFDHAQPSTSCQGINSSAGWTPKGPNAVFDHAQPIASEGINSCVGGPNDDASARKRACDHLGLSFPEDEYTGVDSLPETLGEPEGIQEKNLDACFEHLGNFKLNSPTMHDFLSSKTDSADKEDDVRNSDAVSLLRSLSNENMPAADGCELLL